MKEYSITNEENVKTIVSDKWTKYECNFVTGDKDTSVLFFTWIYANDGEASADFYVDDIFLEEVIEEAITSPSTEPSTDPTEILGTKLPGLNDSDPDPYTYTRNPKLNWFFPILIVAIVEFVVIVVFTVYTLVSRKSKNK